MGVGTLGFNSLQTGKCIQRRFKSSPRHSDTVSIPFKRESTGGLVISRPSFTETFFSDNWQLETDNYSPIPFKRESVSKVFRRIISLAGTLLCFNSLQTGKRI